MMGATHRFTGAAAGLGLAIAMHWNWPMAAASTGLAMVFAAGPTSPDVDQEWAWHLADKMLPDELLGHGGLFRHRGLAHWWGLPAVGFAAAWFYVPHNWQWVAWAVLIGWSSHLVGDFIFGKASPFQGRGPGIPFAPWWAHFGFGLDAGGKAENMTRITVLPAVFVWQLVTYLLR